MKTIFGVLVVLCAMGLAGCGDKGSDAEGTWVLDPNASYEASRADLKAQMPAETPPEMVKQAEEQSRKGFQGMSVTIVLKGDKTFTTKFALGDNKKDETGTWSAAGDKVTMQPKTKDGKPVEGTDAKALTLTLKGNTLSGKPEPNSPVTVVLKRG